MIYLFDLLTITNFTRLSQFRERYKGYKVPVASLKTSQMLKQLGILDTLADINSRPKAAAAVETVLEPDAAAAEEGEELAEVLDRPPTVSVLSKEQAVDLLKPVRGGRGGSRSKSATTEDSLEGKFVDLVDLLPPVPVKGEFDVNKIKSSAYFFS
jgi:DNA-directed RNA polymerase